MRWPNIALKSLVFLGVLTSGCANGFEFHDDVDLDLDFRLFDDRDHLHLPYVDGAQMSISAHHRRDKVDMTGWSLESNDAEVLQVTPRSYVDDDARADVVAVGPGDADILLVDDSGDVQDSAEVRVRAPTRVELLAAGPVFLDREDVEALTPSPQILNGGLATFLVRYFDRDTPLHGNGALEALATDAVETHEERSFFFEDRDWLQVRPLEEGIHEVELLANGRAFARFDVRAVGPDAIGRVALHGEDEDGADRDDLLLVIGRSYDAEEEPIYGVEYTWDLAGRSEPGAGDMFRYPFDPDATNTLGATFEGHRAEATIQASEGYVDSSNEVGCRTGGSGAPPAYALVIVVFAGLRRRVTAQLRARSTAA